MTNTMNSKGQIVRWKSYKKDRFNLITSKWDNGYIVLNLGTGKKGIRQYKVTKENGEVHCNCYDHQENNSICKHQIAVWNYNKQQADKSVIKTKKVEVPEEIQKVINRW